MAKVIKFEEKKQKEIECKDCAALISYYPNEIKYRIRKNKLQCDFYIECPNCNCEIDLK